MDILKKNWAISLFWGGTYLYYAQFYYASGLHIFVYFLTISLISLLIIAFIQLFFVQKTKALAFFGWFSIVLFALLFGYARLKARLAGPVVGGYSSGDPVIIYGITVPLALGIAILALRIGYWMEITRFFHFFSLGIVGINLILWPGYRMIKTMMYSHTVKDEKGVSFRSYSGLSSHALPDIYVILLDEHPSPRTLGGIFPGTDTFFLHLKRRGFLLNDSIWSNVPSTMHVLSCFFQVNDGINRDTIVFWGLLREAELIRKLKEVGYIPYGILPFYLPLQQLDVQWVGYGFPTYEFARWPLLSPLMRNIKHIYDVLFANKLKKFHFIPENGKNFWYIHFFISHGPFATGKGGAFQSINKTHLYQRIQGALRYTHTSVIGFLDTLMTSYRSRGDGMPVILVMSDHGFHLGEPERLGIQDSLWRRRLKHQAFLAAYIPVWDEAKADSAVRACVSHKDVSRLIEEVVGVRE